MELNNKYQIPFSQCKYFMGHIRDFLPVGSFSQFNWEIWFKCCITGTFNFFTIPRDTDTNMEIYTNGLSIFYWPVNLFYSAFIEHLCEFSLTLSYGIFFELKKYLYPRHGGKLILQNFSMVKMDLSNLICFSNYSGKEKIYTI